VVISHPSGHGFGLNNLLIITIFSIAPPNS
jgi:hypothetical protein